MSGLLRSTRRRIAHTVGERAVLGLTRVFDRANRLSYDLSAEGRRSSARLSELRDAGRGQRCFILGNGPSLAGMDLAPLRHEVTFGLNRAYLLFDRLGFATTYLVAVNRLVVEQAGDDILAVGVPTFMSWHARRAITRRDVPIYLPTSRGREFSLDPTRSLWEGATVTFVALQLAHYMGFNPVVLIGVDHSFATKGPAHKEVTSTGDDPNHFDPNYFGKGFRWNLPDLETSELAYRTARAAYETSGRVVLNATVGGNLEVFQRADYASVLGLGAQSTP